MMKTGICCILAGLSCFFLFAEEPTASDLKIQEAFTGHMADFAQKVDADKLKAQLKEKGPEGFCWVEFRYLNGLLTSYALTGETEYLEMFRESFAVFAGLMEEGEDGYLGWFGPTLPDRKPKDNPELEVDEIQTNFRAMGILARWVELARREEAYASEHAETITHYLTLMEKQLFPKWDARDHFVEIPGKGGVYRWMDYPIQEGVSLSFEKLSIMVNGLLALYRVTENPIYMKRALEVGAWYKSNLILKDGHYEWMSWVPAGEWDIHPEKEDAWRVGWMAPDPNAAWYVASVSIALNLYQHGLLFDDEDLARFIQTQKEMCWNGNMENPEYRSVSGETSKWIKGRFLSLQLANHDSVLKQLAFYGPHEAQQLADSSSSWKGGVAADEYIQEKYLTRDLSQPYLSFGEEYLQDEDSKAFYTQINQPVREAAVVIPRTPSIWHDLNSNQ
ncbi:hypothetical protein P0Y35_10145 [Kiritimatiellaeota bacterium B1221]|nr:hypothetical protein [Kiritimatiellaeota bacterium B1221]